MQLTRPPFSRRLRVRAGALGTLAIAAAGALVLPGCELQTSEELAQLEGPIIGGQPDATHKGVVSLLKKVEGGFFPACSGTLLTQNLVLTAHHCVAALTSDDSASVECGKTEFEATEGPDAMLVSVAQNVWKEKLTPFRVAEVWVPPGSNAVCGRDIALLMLAGDGVPAELATPIAPRLETQLRAEEAFVAVGYGLQDPEDKTGETSGHRMISSDAQVFCEGAACGTSLVSDGEFIANSPVCPGDSGGPALDADGLVSGVTSRGDEKCTIGIYSGVAAWRDFIIEKTFVAAKSGKYAPPAWAGEPPPGYEPAVDPLGMSCSGACSLGYQCWAESGTPPGICVPACSASDTTCPDGYSCDTGLGACTKPTSAEADASSKGCALAGPPRSFSGVLLGISLFGFQLSRRRRAARRR